MRSTQHVSNPRFVLSALAVVLVIVAGSVIGAQIPPRKPANAQSLDELLLFFPAKYPAGDYRPAGLRFEDAWFAAADGTRLHGWYCPCERPRAVVLFAHGNAGNVSHRAPRLAKLQRDLRVAVLAFDYRGYGRSAGAPTAEGILQDARAARKFLAARAGVAERQVVLMGESLGGAVAAEVAADGARGLVLESTFSSLQDVAAHHYPRLAWLVPEGKLNAAARLAKYQGPLLVSHGDADRTIPYELGRKLYEAAAGPGKEFFTVAGGDHNDPRPAEYYQVLDRFLGSLPQQ
jgi:fermentation-respiration switch protein FrsA (DUF1100 family)